MNKKLLGRIALSIIVPVTVVIVWTIYGKKKPTTYSDSGKMAIGMTARYSLVIQSKSGKQFYFDFNTDTLKTGGTLSPDSAAQIFINYCAERYSGRIRELRDEIVALKRGESGLAVGDSVAVMMYDSGHWAGNYVGRIVRRNWATNRYLVRSWSLYSRKFGYQWIDAANLEKCHEVK